MRRMGFMLMFVMCVLLSNLYCANASIIFNEILADPASSLLGDSNNDGVTSFRDDEFIEFFNLGANPISLFDWYVADAVKTRHVFDIDSILNPNEYLVVFGGGAPSLSNASWQTASTGQLGLNNSGDHLYLYDSTDALITDLQYFSLASNDQSLQYWNSSYVLHSSIEESEGRLFSPGTDVDGLQNSNQANAVPEPATWMLFFMGMLAFYARDFLDFRIC